MPKPRPRPYQVKAVDNTLDILFNQPGKNPIVATPPGCGKSLLIAWTMKGVCQRLSDMGVKRHASDGGAVRLMNLTHVKELIAQDARALDMAWPDAPYGVFSAGLGARQSTMPLTIASVQSVYKNLDLFGRQDGVFVDEAHLVSPAQDTMYQAIFQRLLELNPNMFIAGYSATPWRMKHGLLTDGPTFNCTAFDNTQRDEFVELIDDGYLVPLVARPTDFVFDVSEVRKVAGEFNQNELQAKVNVIELSKIALTEALQVAVGRKKGIIFCAGIDHVKSVTAILKAWGEKAVYIHSRMNSDDPYDRDEAIKQYLYGDARWIVNDGILTTGFDAPFTDCIILLKPTMSPGLHVQILGRGIRPVYHPNFDIDMLEDRSNRLEAILMSGRPNCLVLDFSGNIMRLGPINDPTIPQKKGKGNGEVPVKICPECGCYNHTAVRFCKGFHWDGRPCTHEFQFESKLEETASTETPVVRNEPIMHWFKVDRVDYEPWEKKGAPPAMRVHYFCGLRRFTEIVAIERMDYPGTAAREWWRKRLPNYPPPPTTADGLTFVQHLPKPKHIYVHVNTKWPRVLAQSYDEVPKETTMALPSHLRGLVA